MQPLVWVSWFVQDCVIDSLEIMKRDEQETVWAVQRLS